ncbi:hypothetical protein CHISP_0536 [Chitinispirillum alkaliphilum]|nr:hypothetical protein CHISP_0536 [Chitinispirillum alkaliphilum]
MLKVNQQKITVHEKRVFIINHVEKVQSSSAKELLKIHGSVIEKVFGHTKGGLALRRIIGFEIDRAIANWSFVAVIHNLKKI